MLRVAREKLAVKWHYILAGFVCVGICLLAYRQTFGASTPVRWDDVRSVKIDVRLKPGATAGVWYTPGCVPQRIEVDGWESRFETEACVVEAGGNFLASYPEPGALHEQVNYAVKMNDDSRFHVVTSASPSGLVLLKDGRFMGSRWHNNDLFIASASTLRPYVTQDSEYGMLKSYTFVVGGDLVFRDGYGNSIIPRRIDLSSNSKYAAVEVQRTGNVLVDVAARKATYVGVNEHYDDTPVVQAVSSDGKYLAVVDRYYDTAKLYIIDDNCGQATPRNPSPTCESIDFSDQLQANYTLSDTIPYELLFSADDNTLVMKSYIRKGGAGVIETTITPNANTRQLKYLALGDSYSSGEGDIANWPTNYYISGTEADGGCHISSRSYPFLLRDKWGINPSAMKSVACSGAQVLSDFFGGGYYAGQGRQLANMNDVERMYWRNQALYDFTPGVSRQIDFVEKYQPARVTFTGGGNDVGFAEVLQYCATSSMSPLGEMCNYAHRNSQLRADLNRRIDDQYAYNKAFIEKIRQVSPATEIYMVGYPQFVSLSRLWCSDRSPVLDKNERVMIRESVARLNNVLKKAARDTGVYYVDIEDSLEGGQICDGSLYMTGPVGTIATKHVLRDANMYHPNHRGHAKIADTIAQKIADGMDYDILDMPLETNGHKVVRTAVLPDYAGIGSTHTIRMDASMFGPNGEVYIEMFSQHVNLGRATVGSDGVLQATITIPRSVGIGTHLLTISGLDPDGEAISAQQFVTVISNIPGDADGDGIPDDEDSCFVISEWYENGVDICAVGKRPTPIINRSILANPTGTTITRQRGLSDTAAMMSDGISGAVSDDYRRGEFDYIEARGGLYFWWVLGVVGIITTGAILHYAKKDNQQGK